MNNTETVTSVKVIFSAAQFAPIFGKAWYVVINGALYEKVDDYEKENGELCTVFSAIDCDDVFEIDYSLKEKAKYFIAIRRTNTSFSQKSLRIFPLFRFSVW